MGEAVSPSKSQKQSQRPLGTSSDGSALLVSGSSPISHFPLPSAQLHSFTTSTSSQARLSSGPVFFDFAPFVVPRKSCGNCCKTSRRIPRASLARHSGSNNPIHRQKPHNRATSRTKAPPNPRQIHDPPSTSPWASQPTTDGSNTAAMTKDSRRSSVAGSAPPSQCGNDEEGVSGTLPSSPAAGDSSNALDASSLGARAIESQPMTVSNSNSSNPSMKDGSGSGHTPAAPYGTRSRNRTGNPRPNYAEDKELDAEFEVSSTRENPSRRPAASTDPTNSLDFGQSQSSSSKGVTVEPDSSLTIQNHHKVAIPGTSTFSAGLAIPPSGQVSKKRKITGQSVAATLQPQMQTVSNNGSTGEFVDRSSSIYAQVVPGFRETNMLGFDTCKGRLKNNRLIADDGTMLKVNDHVYLVCEPPGEPYYLGRIMEFLHVNNDTSQPIDALRLNWYYRPKDIGRTVNDTRQVFASMHSDVSPLTALRGKCQIKHKSEVERLDDLRRSKDIFWYEKLYDRYIHRFYDVIPTSQVINVPIHVKTVLDERWRYIVVEPGRGKELTSAVKSCKKCSKYCASNDSVDCAVCQSTYHMSCVNPPLLKKPSRGFAWACGPCSKAQERKLEARNTPNTVDPAFDADDEHIEEEGESTGALGTPVETGQASPAVSSPVEVSFHPGTAEQIHQASLWLFRYLGIHCKVEDALDYDDRIYPRASSRLGPRHQAIVPPWPGQPVEYVKPVEIKKKFMKGGGQKKDAKLSKETVAALEAEKISRDKRPKWVMDEPPGYVVRGEDFDNDDERNTARLIYKKPEAGDISTVREDDSEPDEAAREQLVLGYMARAGTLARPLGLPDLSTNLLDVALETLRIHGFETESALQALINMDKKVFKEPELTTAELKKFEDGVSKFGSEWHSIKKHVKTLKSKDVVRFYYTWKKTERGKQIWGNYSGRKNKKEARRAEPTVGKLQDDVADEHDDSAFDNDKAFEKKRGFQCKFCATRSSRQWRRAPNTPAGTMISENPAAKTIGKDKGTQLMVALCRRCAELWRRYAIQWEDIDEVAKKVVQAGGRTWKRKIDEELLKELAAANEVVNHAPHVPFASVSAGGTPTPAPNLSLIAEPGRKKGKSQLDALEVDSTPDPIALATSQKKKTIAEKPPPPPPVPELPKLKNLPCAICGELEPLVDQYLTCKECRISVHRNCYGVMGENRSPGKWVCDMCSNDKNPQVSIQYKCVLCPVEKTEHDFVEPLRITNKKRTERERERERVERENNLKAAEFFRKRQEEMNKPASPREPLKRTANNNWVHVTCAVFTPEVKFGNAKALEPSEGIPSIASARYDEICKVCKRRGGACVGCHSCRVPVHVECAHQADYILGFDIAPVKGSRRDQVNVVNINGEVGTMIAAIWCKEHIPTKTIVHQMHDIIDESGLNALQLYVQNFKQADLTLTGTVRKATLVNQSTKAINQAIVAQVPNRRISVVNANGNSLGARSTSRMEEGARDGQQQDVAETSCTTCGVHTSPRWWPFPHLAAKNPPAEPLAISIETNGGQIQPHDLLGINGLPSHTPQKPGENHAALAAAALHQNPAKSSLTSTEFQCHQCHWKKVKKEPTPSSPRIPPLVSSLPVIQQEATQPPTLTASTVTVSALIPEIEAGNSPAHYAWPQPLAYTPNGPFAWQRPSPVLQGTPIHGQTNGNRSSQDQLTQADNLSSHSNPPSMQRGPAHVRQTGQSVPQSPHQNGHMPLVPNGYPPSPHRLSSSGHLPNGTYRSYASTQPSTHHLTNGGPPPRAPDYPTMNISRLPPSFSGTPTSPPLSRETFHQGLDMSPASRPPHASVRPLHSEYPAMNFSRLPPAFGSAHGSPLLSPDSRPLGRESSGMQSNDRPNDGRVNGGASASPSLQNLLS